MKLTIFAMLDTTFDVPQHIQMLMFRIYAENNSLAISFYGSELCGTEQNHLLLKSYLDPPREKNFLFFTVRQFLFQKETTIEAPKLDCILIKEMIEKGITLHFANENRKISCQRDLDEIKLLITSTQAR